MITATADAADMFNWPSSPELLDAGWGSTKENYKEG